MIRLSTLRTLLATLAALLLVTTGTAAAPAGTARQDLDAATVERLDRAITGTMKRAGIPGVIVGLWMPGRGTYVRAFGVSDETTGAPMKTGLHMRIGSVTKTFTVTGLLQLVDQGRVGLDDPIAEYVDGVPEGERITLRRLAGMRSGLFNYSDDPGFQRSLESDPQRTFTPRQLLDYAFAHPLGFAPGTRFQYSNTNLILLGLVIEKVTGQPVGAYLEQHVYEPLGLARTSFPTDNTIPDPHAQGYTNATPTGATTVATHWNPSWAWSAGAMISDLEDLRTWAPALASGKPLLTPETQRQRLAFAPTGFTDIGYGLGIFRDHGWVGHNGELPGYEALAVHLPSEDATLVVLVNSDVDYRGDAFSTLIGKAVTEIVTPDNVFTLPAAAQSTSEPPTPSR
ncbi:serine hydrolase [Streptomyces sp. FIT100]|uniref:serine hydrolase domain-containing protein n=1 Tax=Streptomyces sp. FIT100 TaxID=2837956 RepID=UPI0021C7A897|nr:serine hydrolase domain-containing protein [Streptomyces sp. FIT100]UUN26653.1 beta-lactamase family protein [Streptomyces sp. FIT100]